MADLDKLMENFAERAEKLVVPDQAKRKVMTAAGAEVLTKALKEETRDKHYRIRKIGKVKHLADSVTFQNTDVNGEDNGNSVVGFQGKESGINHARIARFLNDGTKYITGDSFVDNTRRDQAAKVLAAEKAVYDSGGEGRGSTD